MSLLLPKENILQKYHFTFEEEQDRRTNSNKYQPIIKLDQLRNGSISIRTSRTINAIE